MKTDRTPDPGHAKKLGTFAGVFTPSILTILGIILFLRMGFVVGSGGTLQALFILTLATAVTVITSSSLSAIATNITVRKGGPYYIISRTLGPELGGAIGLILFLAQAISVAFYCVGFAEGLIVASGWSNPYGTQIIAASVIAVLFLFAWLGSDWASKLQMGVMVILGISLLAFFVGALPLWSSERFSESLFPPAEGPGFWLLFAIFFPAVTGFTQGVAMSGDLKDPGRSIPSGVFASIGISTVIYAAVILVFAGAVAMPVLRDDAGAMRGLAPAGWLIDAGVLSATLSSGMASFLGAPRILQALAGDRIIGILTPFAAGVGPSENPRRAVLLTLAIALAILGLGSINAIAPVVSMFFLLSYGLLNYACFYEARAHSPSFRPRFRRFGWRASLIGALACLGVMLAIDLTAGLVSVVLLLLVFLYLRRAAVTSRWSDSSRSYVLAQMRKLLLGLSGESESSRDWRPHVLAFSDDAYRRESLLRFASWIEGGAGYTTLVRLVFGDGPEARRERAEAEAELVAELRAGGHDVFPLVINCPDLSSGMGVLLQSYGVGPLRANTILLNWLEEVPDYRDEEREKRYGANLRAALRRGKNVVVLEAEDDEWQSLLASEGKPQRIDIWWFEDASSRLLLLLGYLMTRCVFWADATLRVCSFGDDAGSPSEASSRLEAFLHEVRIEAEVVLIGERGTAAIVEHSADATLVLCPFRVRSDVPCDPFGGDDLEQLLCRLPVTALGIAAEDVQLASEPDAGPQADRAAAADRVREAEAKARKAEEEAGKAEQAVTALAARAEAAPEASPEAADELERLRDEAERAQRRAAKARAKALSARREAGLEDPPRP